MPYIGVILVGGRGSRLKEITKNTPKPLIKIDQKPFLDFLIYQICKYKFKKIYLVCSYKYNLFKNRYHNKYILGVKIECIYEKNRKGTAGALFYVKNKIDSDFFLFNGDSYFPIDLDNFYNFSIKQKKIISIACAQNKNYKSNKKISQINIRNNLVYFSKFSSDKMNGGIYFIQKKFLKFIKNEESSLENNYLINLIQSNHVAGKFYRNFFIDIGLKKNLKKAKQELKKNFTQKAFFLDRDGVINQDKGYVHKIKNLVFLKDTFKGINLINKKKFLIIVVTNQSGIGRGYYKLKDFLKLSNYILKKAERNNSKIDQTYFCPHHPIYGLNKYKKKCNCRKPKPGLLLMAKNDWSIQMKKSVMIGDAVSDKHAAKNSGVKFYYKKAGSLYSQVKNILGKI